MADNTTLAAAQRPTPEQIHSMIVAAQASTIGPLIAALVAGLSEEEQTARLAVAVQSRLIEPETAAAIVAGQIAPRQLVTPTTPAPTTHP